METLIERRANSSSDSINVEASESVLVTGESSIGAFRDSDASGSKSADSTFESLLLSAITMEIECLGLIVEQDVFDRDIIEGCCFVACVLDGCIHCGGAG